MQNEEQVYDIESDTELWSCDKNLHIPIHLVFAAISFGVMICTHGKK